MKENRVIRKLKYYPLAVVDAIGCPIEAVHVIINEVEKDNWGIGGTPASVKFPDK